MAIVGALVLVAGSADAEADFYTPPSPLPQGRPGSLIRSEPATADEAPGVSLPAHAWTILYRSTTATGQPTAVSGTVLVPTAPWRGSGPRPLVGYAIGSQGLASRCAPSLQLAAGTEYEASLIANVLNRGWAVALTDYPGLGTPGLHPYVVGRALGRSVLDAVRAALQLHAAGLSRHAPLAIYGYSEGGEAAGWALQLAPTYAPDLRLSGGVVGAAPANFNAEYHYLDGGRFEFLIMYTALGMNSAYPQLDLERYLNATGRAYAAEMRGTCISDAVVDGQLAPTNISAFVTTNPIGLPAWQQAFAANDLGGIAPGVPVLLGAGQHDEVMDYATAGPGLYHDWCAHGANVSFDDIQPGTRAHRRRIPLLRHRTRVPRRQVCGRPARSRARLRHRARRRFAPGRLPNDDGLAVACRRQPRPRARRRSSRTRRAAGPLPSAETDWRKASPHPHHRSPPGARPIPPGQGLAPPLRVARPEHSFVT